MRYFRGDLNQAGRPASLGDQQTRADESEFVGNGTGLAKTGAL